MPLPISSSAVKPILIVPCGICGFCSSMSTSVMIAATPALSSEPSSVVPSVVMMSSPIISASAGFCATVITCDGSPGSAMSPPW